ncbi:MAG: hypothetical protein ACRCYS_02650, partial [Beijerinckiaceae bacterium]
MQLNLSGKTNQINQFASALQRLAAHANNALVPLGRLGQQKMPAMPPGGGGGRRGGRNGFHPNASVRDRAEYRAVNAVESRIVSGSLNIDVARSKLRQQGFTPEETAQAEKYADEYTKANPQFERAQVLNFLAEIRANFKSAADEMKVVPEALKMAREQILTGATAPEATQNLFRLINALGTGGFLTDAEGNYNPQSAEYIKAAIQAARTEGVDVNPATIQTVMRNLKITGQTITPDAFLKALLTMGDIGAARYGNAADQLVASLTGQGGVTQAAMKKQAEFGLITMQPNPDDPRKMQRTSTVDENLLREDPGLWIEKHITGKGGAMNKAGLDVETAKVSDLANFFSLIFSRQTAKSLATTLVNQRGELQNKLATAKAKDTSNEDLLLREAQSLNVKLQSVSSSVAQGLGDFSEMIKFATLPLLDLTAWAAKKLAPESQASTLERLGAAGVIGGAAAVPYAGQGLMVVAALRLSGSATALTAAAAALSASAKVGAAGNAATGAAAAGGAAAGGAAAATATTFQKAKALLGKVAKIGSGVGLGYLAGDYQRTHYPETTKTVNDAAVTIATPL